MRTLVLLFALSALAPLTTAQVVPVAADRAQRTAPPPSDPTAQPVAVRVLAGGLGAGLGTYGGFQLGEAVEPDGFLVSDGAVYGSLLGSTLGAALMVTATGDRDGFWRTLAGASLGTLGGLALASFLTGGDGSRSIEQALLIGLPVGSTVGATLANAAGGD